MDDAQKQRHYELVLQLIEIATELDWVIAIPAADLNQTVEGVVLGTSNFIEELAVSLDKVRLQYLESNDIVNSKKKKDPTFH